MHGVHGSAGFGIGEEGSRGRLVVPHEVCQVPHVQHALHCVRLAGT